MTNPVDDHSSQIAILVSDHDGRLFGAYPTERGDRSAGNSSVLMQELPILCVPDTKVTVDAPSRQQSTFRVEFDASYALGLMAFRETDSLGVPSRHPG